MRVIESVAKEFAKNSKPKPRDYSFFPQSILARIFGEEAPPEFEKAHVQLALGLINSNPNFDLMAFKGERHYFANRQLDVGNIHTSP